eukprot:TRINITY_DN27892_c0_g1_i1.p1 TRINITY_DN27892_c0_g1~~TRINITY_DN27892_c0_g1_i1.p1  ORF type:complete len:219 (-),score=74.16 TRINITY_DN27892_c0_g1_i1:34-690(-)
MAEQPSKRPKLAEAESACAVNSKGIEEAAALLRHVAALVATGQLQDAEAACEDALKASEQNAQAWFLRGFVLDVQHRHAEVASCMRRCVQIDDGRADAWLFIAEHEYRVGAFEEALEAYERVQRLSPDSPAGSQAAADAALLRRNLRSCVEPGQVWEAAAPAIAKTALKEEANEQLPAHAAVLERRPVLEADDATTGIAGFLAPAAGQHDQMTAAVLR